MPQVLRDHNSRNRADSGNNDRDDPGEFPGQPHAGHADAAKLTDHNLIHNAKGRLKHGLQSDRDRQAAYGTEERCLAFHSEFLPYICLLPL